MTLNLSPCGLWTLRDKATHRQDESGHSAFVGDWRDNTFLEAGTLSKLTARPSLLKT